MFQRFHWNRLAAQFFAHQFSPVVCAVESGAGAAIIPAVINHGAHRLELLGEALFDYRDVLHAGDPDVLWAAWEMLADFELPLFINCVEGPENWEEFQCDEFARAPWVEARALTEQQFRSAHSRLARQLRRMQWRGVELFQYSGTDREVVRHLYRLKCEQFSGDPDNLFRDERRREFMVRVGVAEAENCQVFALEDPAQWVVAGLVTFLDGNMRRFYTIYFDPQWAMYSPGVALVYEVTARSLAQGVGCDYMTGEYPYKLRFANASRVLYRIQASTMELRAMVERRTQVRIA